MSSQDFLHLGAVYMLTGLKRKLKRRLKEHKCCREDLVVEDDYY
jgi:hypothetical protein